MNNAFWLGVWPGISQKELVYIKEKIKLFIKNIK